MRRETWAPALTTLVRLARATPARLGRGIRAARYRLATPGRGGWTVDRLARLARGRRPLIALSAGLAVAVLAGALAVLGGTGHPARAPVTAPAAVTVPDPGSRAARWLAGQAGRLLSAVSADLGRLTVAERSANRGAARRAGLRLSADARAALLGPVPPRGARLYRAALTDLERAGGSAASGRLRAAAAGLRAGESTITEVTALANSPAKAAVPGAKAQEPAGQ